MSLTGIAVDIFVPYGHYPRIDTYSYSAASILVVPPSVMFNYAVMPWIAEKIAMEGPISSDDKKKSDDKRREVFKNIEGLRVGSSVLLSPYRLRVETKDFKRNRRVNMYGVDAFYRLWFAWEKAEDGISEKLDRIKTFFHNPVLPLYFGRNSFPVYVVGVYDWKGKFAGLDENKQKVELVSVFYYPYELSRKGTYPVKIKNGGEEKVYWARIEGITGYTGREDYVPFFIDPTSRYRGSEETHYHYLSAIWASARIAELVKGNFKPGSISLAFDDKENVSKYGYAFYLVKLTECTCDSRSLQVGSMQIKIEGFNSGRHILLSPRFELKNNPVK